MRSGKMTWMSTGLIVGSLAHGVGMVAVAQDSGQTFYACEKDGQLHANRLLANLPAGF
jgi:hypothetical protein